MQINQEQNIPIDIHTNKLLEWLISRRHCSREWQEEVVEVRRKINHAIQDMPEVEEITRLLAGSYINYFHCLRIVELLKETEASSKNIFGQYSSQRMKDWQDVVRMYEKNNLYAAEVAQMLMRNVNYEVPSLKRQIAKCQQMQEESARKEIEYGKLSQETREKFYLGCKEIGIEGQNVKKELLDLLKDLPIAFQEIAKSATQLSDTTQFYKEFLLFTLKSEHVKVLPVLEHIIEKGNTTTYEWRCGEPPEVVEESHTANLIDTDTEHSNSDQIDFGDAGSIDFGDDNSSSANGDFVHIDKLDLAEGEQIYEGIDNGAEISWDLTTDSPVILLDNNGEGGKVARGEDSLSILDNPKTRNILLNELRELEGFLEQRQFEMKAEGDILSANQFQLASPSIQLQTVDGVAKMLLLVRNLRSQLTTVKMQHLYLIKSSSKYVDRLTNSLKQKLLQADKMLQSQEMVVTKRQSALSEQRDLEPQLQLIVQKTKELQKQIEEDISKRYKNRRVNIMGGINTL